jgi:hypothetical protein
MQEHDLPGSTRYVVNANSLDDAKRVMDQVHAYRAPLPKG